MDINKTLEFYCNNEMAELKKICYPLFIKIGGISDKDYDDFYSIALEALSDSAIRYKDDRNCQFRSFLIGNVQRKFKTEIRDRNRIKRIPVKQIDSMSNLVTEDGLQLSELIPSEFNTFDEACEHSGWHESKIEKYLNKLSKLQRKIVSLLSDGYKPAEIKEALHISSKEYLHNLAAIQAYENVKILL